MTDDTQRRLEAASRLIGARAHEIEANDGPAPFDIQAATEGLWSGHRDQVQVTYERCFDDECFGIHNSPDGPVDCDGRPI